MGRSALFTRFFAFWCIFLISTTSSNYLQDFLAWKWWVGGLVMIMIEIIGFLANSMSLVVLLRPKIRETSFNQLLAVLCIVDTFFIFCNTFSCIHALGVKNGKLRYLTQKWMHFFQRILSLILRSLFQIHSKLSAGSWMHLGKWRCAHPFF